MKFLLSINSKNWKRGLRVGGLSLFIFNSSLSSWSQVDKRNPICTAIRDLYKSKIVSEIQKGVQIELMGVGTKNGKIQCTRIMQIKYDLWEERAKMIKSNVVIQEGKLAEFEESICLHIFCKENGSNKFQLLLNPLWERRVRNVIRSRTSQPVFLDINSTELADQLPKDINLLDVEL